MAFIGVVCVACGNNRVIKHGKGDAGEQRYRCKTESCGKTFQLSHRYKAYGQGVKERIVDMALNGSGIRDTVRV